MSIDFRKVVDAARDGVAVLGGEGRYLYVNDAAVALARSRREEMLGRTYLELWPQLAGSPFDVAFRESVRSGQPARIEIAGLRPGMWVRIDLAPLPDGQVRATGQEITDQKRLEEDWQSSAEQRRRREQQYQFLAKAGVVLNSSLDRQTTIQTVARLAIGVLGDACVVDLFEGGTLRRREVAYDESLGDAGVDRLRSTRVDRYPAAHPVMQASRGKTVLVADYSDAFAREHAASPEHFEAVRAAHLRAVLSVPLLAHGEVLGVISFVWRRERRGRDDEEDRALGEDVARRMALAIDNARRHELLRAALRDTLQIVELVEQSRDFIGFASLAGKTQFLNRPGQALLGLAREEVADKPIDSFFVPEDLPLAHQSIEAALATGASEVELRFRHARTGAAIPVSWNVFVLRNSSGAPDRLATITRDLTEQKRVEAEREELIERLQRALRLAEVFVGILGHDLRNPLGAILTTAQLLQRLGDERVCRLASRIHASGRRMSELIEDLLDFTRIRVGQGMVLHLREADLMELCKAPVEELREAHPSRSIACSSKGDPTGVWDGGRVAQVISNLVGNAVQHSPPDTPIEVTLDGQDPASVRVRVHNLGPPIPDELRAGLFDPFKRPGQRRHQGLGLGLYISDQIARLHGGRLDVDSSERGGTSFTVELPRRAAPPAQARVSANMKQP